MNEKKRVLVIDDEENMRHMLCAMLEGFGYQAEALPDGRAALAALEHDYHFILCDIRMPGMDGLTFLEEAVARECGATIIMMSAFGSVDIALQAMKSGAYDYISKPFKPDEILLTLKKAEEREELRRNVRTLRNRLADLEGRSGLGGMVGASKAMQEIFTLAGKAAPHPATVLITGESGTGKELVARGIHQLSPRSSGPFVAVNCGSLPETLIESELFGYVKGAFTGADRDKAGLFREAHGGTLLLDEIGELPPAMQVKLLRVLQENEIQPVGAGTPEGVDIRVLAATSVNLEQAVKDRSFREDLFYRLNVIRLHLPPLRERDGDISLLAEHFLQRFAARMDISVTGIAPAAMARLTGYHWPGNVRELENVMERAVIMAEKGVILPENLPKTLGGGHEGRRLDDILGGYSIKKARQVVERRLITRALEATGNNKKRASELLELSYPSLLSKIREYGIGGQDES
ncbi:MAG: hypothetical protein CSA34_03195 [Desulfobulbus propionicus]|nr:MAG: hypothetical protein CSA34_03195 [Desulfobulbus propionicus]